jgi:hypothetical protein
MEGGDGFFLATKKTALVKNGFRKKSHSAYRWYVMTLAANRCGSIAIYLKGLRGGTIWYIQYSQWHQQAE